MAMEATVTTVHLPAVLDLDAAIQLRKSLMEELSEAESILLDAEEVERLGTPAVQVLLSAAVTLKAEGRALRIGNATEAVQGAFHDLGLGAQLKSME